MFGRFPIKQVGLILDGVVDIVVGRPTDEEELVYLRLVGMWH
jgi:hypothetical protein